MESFGIPSYRAPENPYKQTLMFHAYCVSFKLHVVACLLGVVGQSLKPVELLSKQLSTFLSFRIAEA